ARHFGRAGDRDARPEAPDHHHRCSGGVPAIHLKGSSAFFDPLVTLYITGNTSPEEIKLAGFSRRSEAVFAVKLYPAGATTNSEDGVTNVFGKCLPVLEEMVEQNMPLLVCISLILLINLPYFVLYLGKELCIREKV
ncbi:hypothetical protein BHM03_00002526, partial [Ensete ventricosum]